MVLEERGVEFAWTKALLLSFCPRFLDGNVSRKAASRFPYNVIVHRFAPLWIKTMRHALLALSLILLLGSKSRLPQTQRLTVTVTDADSGRADCLADLPEFIRRHALLLSNRTLPRAMRFRYEKQNWNNANSVEYHTTVSAHPCVTEVPPGEYTLTVERGKTYRRTLNRFRSVTASVSSRSP